MFIVCTIVLKHKKSVYSASGVGKNNEQAFASASMSESIWDGVFLQANVKWTNSEIEKLETLTSVGAALAVQKLVESKGFEMHVFTTPLLKAPDV